MNEDELYRPTIIENNLLMVYQAQISMCIDGRTLWPDDFSIMMKTGKGWFDYL